MKPILSLITAAAMLTALTACTAATAPDESITLDSLTDTENVSGSTMKLNLSGSWTSEKINAPDMTGFVALQPAGDYMLLSGYGDDDSSFWHTNYALYDPADGTLSVPFHCLQQNTEEIFIEVEAVLQETDGFTVLYSSQIKDDDGLYGEKRHFAERYDTGWTYLSETEFQCLSDSKEVTGIVKTADGYCFIESAWGGADVRFVDGNWNRTGKLAGSVDDDAKLFTGADGAVYLCTARDVKRIDTETMKSETLEIIGLPSKDLSGGFAGWDGIPFCVYDRHGVYAVHEDMTAEQILDWSKSNFFGEYVRGVQRAADGSLCISCFGDSEGFWRLKARSQEEADSIEIITIASVSDESYLREIVGNYNRASRSVQFVIQDYSDYYDAEASAGHYYDKAVDAFNQDLLSGTIPDIIITDDLPYRQYINKGMFEDMNTWMAADEDFRKEDYLTNFFDALEDDGKLYKLSYGYGISTVSGKTEFVGGKEGLTIAEYNALTKSLPEGMDFANKPTSWSVFGEFCLGALEFFVDREHAVCSFDSSEMIELLEFCGSFPSDRSIYFTQDTYELADQYDPYRNNEVCLKYFSIYTPYDFHTEMHYCFADEPVTLIGFPMPDSSTNGAKFMPCTQMAMYSGSKHKAEIWEFFKYLLSEDYQKTLEYDLPVNRNALAQKMEAAVAGEGMAAGNEEDDSYLKPTPMTQEEADRLMAYIEEIQVSNERDATIYSIVYEEADMYFAGDQTAERAVANMQSRVSLYLAEQS